MNSSIFAFKAKNRVYAVILLSLYPLLGLSYALFLLFPQMFYWRAWEYFEEIVYTHPQASFWHQKEKGDLSRDYILSYQNAWQTTVSCDSEGFRSVPIGAPHYPILVVGDSHVWGSGLSDSDTIPWQLAIQLNTPVFNGGRTLNPLPHILKHPKLKETKIIIELIAEHRIHKNLFSEEFKAQGFSPYTKSNQLSFVHPKRYFWPLKILRHFNYLSLFRELTRYNFDEWIIHRRKHVHLDFNEEEAACAALNIARRSKALQDLGYTYYFAVVPTRKFMLSSFKDADTLLAQKRFRTDLEKLGVRSINLHEIFSKQQDIHQLYLPTDSHISRLGSFLIAEEFAKRLL